MPEEVAQKPIAVQFDHVTKRYKLYSSERRRLLGFFSKRVHYREICANDDLSFTVRQGETVALIGPNGAGKSTALKLVTGVSYPTSGTVTVNGRVAALLQLRAGFDGQLTGRQNIRMRAQIAGMSKEEIEKMLPRVIRFSELGDYIDQPLRTYSSGMKARLGFAFAVNVKPEILIVDEALSVGDKRFNRKCKRRVNKITSRDKVTMLFVTHSAESARNFCERGMVIIEGHLLFDGPIDEALEFYDNYLDRTDDKAGEED